MTNINMLQKGVDKITKQNILRQLKSSAMTMQDLEEELESFFRSLVRTKVSLLNALSHKIEMHTFVNDKYENSVLEYQQKSVDES